MNRALAFVVTLLCVSLFIKVYWIWYLRSLRRPGDYPRKGTGTLFDVRQLLLNGEKEAAVRLYAQIYKINPEEARKSVEELEKSLKSG